MATRRRPRRRVRTPDPREPKGAIKYHTTSLIRVWHVAQEIITMAIEPLLEIWPEEKEDAGYLEPTARAPRLGPLVTGGRGPSRTPDPRFGTFPGAENRATAVRRVIRTAYPAPRRRQRSGPFATTARRKTIRNLTDSDLRKLWPNIDPEDIRKFAPWATSREEVYRLAYPAGSPEPNIFDLESKINAGIRSAQLHPSTPPTARVEVVPPRRSPEAFKLRRLPKGALPVIFDGQGNPLPPPPRPKVLSTLAIRGQMDWAKTALEAVVTEGNLSLLIGPAGNTVRGHSHRDINRVLAINLREEVPGMQAMINAWRETNVNLIESGIMAPHQGHKLRPSLLTDVSNTIEQAHRKGLRVEVLAQELVDRYNVSDKRAELIARDQILKLNGQITKQRQQSAGVTKYKWISSKDERVRETHALLDGTIQDWNNPPDVGGGRFEHPGGDYNCRCIAKPVPPDWLTS